jgi:CMP-N-acetylneuraminic acid synthetase/spore coat polysaccharide biosynthesis predicted glycosyltransferase SpsG
MSNHQTLRTLIVIPARGGSKGIPRKNLAPIAGKPLIGWAIQAALGCRYATRVVVSTDDDEIGVVARRFGAGVWMRPAELALDHITLDPVIANALEAEEAAGHVYDLVLTVQATSPLIRSATIERVVERFGTEDVDTILTATDDTHLAWVERDGKFVPAYEARVNRQQLPRRYHETGGILATRRANVTPKGRIGAKIALEVLEGFESLDIDNTEDWLVAEVALKRRRVALITIGNPKQGLGHVTRTLTLLDNLNGQVTRVFCEPEQQLAIERLKRAYRPVTVCSKQERLAQLRAFGADLVIHDELNTDPEDILAEKRAGMDVVLFEDNGPSVAHADKVFNALYPAERSDPTLNHWYGPQVYCLRDEFRHAKRSEFRERPVRVLLTFGGTDPAGATLKVLRSIAPVCTLGITVIVGQGYQTLTELSAFVEELRASGKDVQLHQDVPMMSDHMAAADIAFSSAGRTLYELAHMAVPTIVVAQNDLEMKHTFAALENGFLHLGLAPNAEQAAIQGAFQSLVSSAQLRSALRERMLKVDLVSGREFVIQKLLETNSRTSS